MKILTTIQQISEKYPNVILGNTKDESEEFRQSIQDFISEHDFLTYDQNYIDYLTKFSALSYFDSEKDIDFTLFGFGDTITFLNNEFEDEPLIDENGFMVFGHLMKLQDNEENSFYFDTSTTDTNIYVVTNKKETKQYELLCDDFITFLGLINEDKI